MTDANTIFNITTNTTPTTTNKNTTYYLILNRQLGKEEDGKYYLYTNGSWVPDTKSAILGRLMGFDPGEPADSPYAIGNMDIMDTIEVITEQQAREFINNSGNT